MDKSIRFYDAGAEGFYHGLVLGLIALMDNQYKIKSNRESGDGRNIVHQQLLALAKEGRTMVIVTHEMQFAKAVADRMVFLKFVKERLPVN
jgi:ABC-type polysaccharide/polyol phosphate transport system ATPase subunit